MTHGVALPRPGGGKTTIVNVGSSPCKECRLTQSEEDITPRQAKNGVVAELEHHVKSTSGVPAAGIGGCVVNLARVDGVSKPTPKAIRRHGIMGGDYRKSANAIVHSTLCLAVCMLFLAGCAGPATYRDPITRFQQASTIVIAGSRIEYGASTKRERDAAIDRLVARGDRITLSALNDKELRILSGDDLAARLAALDALAKHGLLLLALASSDAPTRSRDAASSLDDAVIRLSSSLRNAPSDEFNQKAGGFAAIAGEVAKLALETKVVQALDKALVSAEKDVQTLIKLLRDDMSALYERQRSILSAARVSATDKYNEELRQPAPSLEKLQRMASGIKKAEDAWDNLPLMLGAGPGLDAMAQAHQKLVDYARSTKAPQDLANLVEAMDAFATRAAIIADAIRTIQQAKE